MRREEASGDVARWECVHDGKLPTSLPREHAFAKDAPQIYDQQGNYRGKLSTNPYDPDSTSNSFGRYGSPFSPDSINNSFGAGSPYRSDSPTNPYGRGLRIEGR